MMLDQNLRFSSAQALTSTAVSSVYDQALGAMLTGSTYTNPAGINFGPNATYFGEDLGVGQGVGTPRVIVGVPVALTGGTSLQVQFQGAPDNGGGTLSGLTWVTYQQTDVIATALLTAGARIASFDWPMRKVGQGLPRFVRLNYVIVGPFSAGSVNADVDLGGGDEAPRTLGQYPSGYTVGA